MLAYSMVGVSVAALAAGILVALRRKAARTRSDSLDIAAFIGGLVLLASLMVAATPPFLAMLDAISASLPADGWPRTALFGALMGVLVFLATRVLFADLLASLLLWATRRDNEDAQPLATIVKDRLILATVSACLFAAFFALVGFDIAWLPLLALPLLVAALPIYQGQIHPWIEYRKAREVEDQELLEIRAWLRETYKDGRMPRFKIRVRETNLNNAMATGGMFGHLIVVGGGLLKNMEPQELKAILAHEMAHVVNRDMLWLTLISIAGSALFITWLNVVSPGPLVLAGGINLVAGFALLLVGAAISFYPLPAIFSPRLEFRADRVAATMLGDTRALASALTRMSELTETPLDQRTWTHPSYKARLEALARLQERLPK
ncbi:MAG: M48 family metalloprotease [Gammaproteobacteria bacterium]|nr:M48 family metalloprotease [Gammaproteobacteria bacterium]